MKLPNFASLPLGRKPVKKVQDGNLLYLDGTPLATALKVPKATWIGMAVLMVVAAAVGVWAFSHYYDLTANAPKRAQEELQANLTREVDLGLPVLSSLVGADNETILAAVQDGGATIVDTSSEDEAAAGDMELAKLPEGVGLDQAAVMKLQGVSKLSPAEAALMLNGSWTMNVVRSGMELAKLPEGVGLDQAAVMKLQGVSKLSPAEAALMLNGSWTMNVVRSGNETSLRLHYCDLSATSPESAITAAMAAEGFPAETATEAGVDDAGNNFQTGKIDVDGTSCTWRVSVCSLSAVYDVSGFPETAQYVGIRLTY